MSYVPKKRKKGLTSKVIIIVLCVVFAIGGGMYVWYHNYTKQESTLMVCGLNEDKTVELLNKTYADVYPITDYFYYGESLDLFKDTYTLNEKDEVSRKSIELLNVCTDEKMTYTMEAFVDRQIDISLLEEGFYELYINDNLVKKRLVYADVLESEPFTTIKRNDKVKHARLLADKNIVHSKDVALDQNYLFLEVKDKEANTSDVDVFIDPYGSIIQAGAEANGLKESEEMYQAALVLKEQMESLGLRVMLSKDRVDDDTTHYGSGSKMQQAYESNARYYIELGTNASTNAKFRGTEIYHSTYASETFANTIMYELKKNTGLLPSNAYIWDERSEGIVSTTLVEGMDKQKVYDSILTIRESGGRATGAARINADAQKNKDFAQSSHGMQAVSINLFYITNSEDVTYWKQHKQVVMSGLAKAFAKAVHLGE